MNVGRRSPACLGPRLPTWTELNRQWLVARDRLPCASGSKSRHRRRRRAGRMPSRRRRRRLHARAASSAPTSSGSRRSSASCCCWSPGWSSTTDCARPSRRASDRRLGRGRASGCRSGAAAAAALGRPVAATRRCATGAWSSPSRRRPRPGAAAHRRAHPPLPHRRCRRRCRSWPACRPLSAQPSSDDDRRRRWPSASRGADSSDGDGPVASCCAAAIATRRRCRDAALAALARLGRPALWLAARDLPATAASLPLLARHVDREAALTGALPVDRAATVAGTERAALGARCAAAQRRASWLGSPAPRAVSRCRKAGRVLRFELRGPGCAAHRDGADRPLAAAMPAGSRG